MSTVLQYPTVFSLLCAALMLACFGRARHTSRRTTTPAIRWVISLQGMVATAGAVAPWLLPHVPEWLPPGVAGHVPDWIVLALIGAMVATQAVSSLLWRGGVPDAFRRPCAAAPNAERPHLPELA